MNDIPLDDRKRYREGYEHGMKDTQESLFLLDAFLSQVIPRESMRLLAPAFFGLKKIGYRIEERNGDIARDSRFAALHFEKVE